MARGGQGPPSGREPVSANDPKRTIVGALLGRITPEVEARALVADVVGDSEQRCHATPVAHTQVPLAAWRSLR